LKGNIRWKIIDVVPAGGDRRTGTVDRIGLLLIKKCPLPERKMIGDLSDTEKVLKGLGLLSKC